jgi:hypothetical protein
MQLQRHYLHRPHNAEKHLTNMPHSATICAESWLSGEIVPETIGGKSDVQVM